MLTDAKYRTNKAYNDKTYERMTIFARKDEHYLAKVKEEAKERGMSVNSFVIECINYVSRNDIDLN